MPADLARWWREVRLVVAALQSRRLVWESVVQQDSRSHRRNWSLQRQPAPRPGPVTRLRLNTGDPAPHHTRESGETI